MINSIITCIAVFWILSFIGSYSANRWLEILKIIDPELATQEIEGKDILIVGTDDQHGCQVGEAGNLNTLANAEAPVNF
jgi:hypothetical protein